jgi:hypothetical protein
MPEVYYVDCEQGSPEWHLERAGLITASMVATVRDTYKSGKNKGEHKAAALNYAFRLACERISGQPLDEGFQTYQMKRGNEMEPEARARHEFEIGCEVIPTGMVKTVDGRFGASADGLIGDDGGAEYKCLVSPERIRSVLIDGDMSEFTDQVQACLWLTGRTWWHFALYCPALEPAGKDLTLYEVQRDDDYIAEMEHDLVEFDKLVCEYADKIKASESTRKNQ